MCAQADLGIITNVGHAHIGNLGTLEAIAREKMDICAHNENMPVLLPDGAAPAAISFLQGI